MNKNLPKRRVKRRYTEDEQRNLCMAFEKSKLNIIDFCKTHNISKSALYQWDKKFKKVSNDHGIGFAPLGFQSNPLNPPEQLTDRVQLTVTFGNSPVQLSVSMSAHRAASFIQEIGYATAIIR